MNGWDISGLIEKMERVRNDQVNALELQFMRRFLNDPVAHAGYESPSVEFEGRSEYVMRSWTCSICGIRVPAGMGHACPGTRDPGELMRHIEEYNRKAVEAMSSSGSVPRETPICDLMFAGPLSARPREIPCYDPVFAEPLSVGKSAKKNEREDKMKDFLLKLVARFGIKEKRVDEITGIINHIDWRERVALYQLVKSDDITALALGYEDPPEVE